MGNLFGDVVGGEIGIRYLNSHLDNGRRILEVDILEEFYFFG